MREAEAVVFPAAPLAPPSLPDDLASMSAPSLVETAPLFRFDNSYARLPGRFFARIPLAPVAAPRLLKLNTAFARSLGCDPDALSSDAGVAVLAGNRVAEGSEPIALAYAGHQFGHFVPSLGDGRAVLLGEVLDRNGARRDIQLKGSGPTPFSRHADGRAAIGPVIREYIVSEAMAALGVPTTRTLAAVATGEDVFREAVLPGAVLTRVAASHVRVGTFQYFAARGDLEAVRILVDHVIARHDPSLAEAPQPARALLDAVIARQARLVAHWMAIGFIHGVMNTDNTAISGETIDYGPCAFLDEYEPSKVFSSIDQAGRYAFANQPRVALWNLARFAETILPLLDASEEAAIAVAEEALGAFGSIFDAARLARLRAKLGLLTEREDDAALAADLLGRMAANGVDHTLFFRLLCDAAADAAADDALRSLFIDPAAFDTWAAGWRSRLATDGGEAEARRAAMRRANPALVPRNHLAEAAIEAAVARDDLRPFEAMVDALSAPYEDRPGLERFALPPRPDERVLRTFCGT